MSNPLSMISKARPANCCNNLYNVSAQGANWLSRNLKIAGVAAWEGAKKVASYFGAFFAKVGQSLVYGFMIIKGAAIQGLHSAKSYIANNPREFKAAAIGIAIGVALAVILSRICSKPATEPSNQSPSAEVLYSSSDAVEELSSTTRVAEEIPVVASAPTAETVANV